MKASTRTGYRGWDVILFLIKASTSLVTISSCVPVAGCKTVGAEVIVPVRVEVLLVRYLKELPLELRRENSSIFSRLTMRIWEKRTEMLFCGRGLYNEINLFKHWSGERRWVNYVSEYEFDHIKGKKMLKKWKEVQLPR